jgi:hypothetical protein
MRVSTGLVAAAAIAIAMPASAVGATTTYDGTIGGDIATSFSFDLVKKAKKRTVTNVQVEGLPIFCDDGGSTIANGGPSGMKARVGDDDRFVGTDYRESGLGGISLAHIRGEFRQRRSLAAGRFSMTIRFIGGEECSSGFVDWTADREDPEAR